MLGAKFLHAINKSKSHDCKRNMSPILVKFRNKFTAFYCIIKKFGQNARKIIP